MKFLLEYKSFYKIGDKVLIEYWYNDIVTVAKITEKINNRFKITHNISESNIKNAPDEIIKSTDIIDHYKI